MLREREKEFSKRWKKGTIAASMTLKVPIVPETITIEEALQTIKSKIKHLDTIDYVYVLDYNKKLVNVLSLKDLYRNPSKTKISNLKRVKLVTVQPHDAEDYASFLSLKHLIYSIPVVDKNGFLLGVVTRRDIFSIQHRKHLENIFCMTGIDKAHAKIDNIFQLSLMESIRHRIFWLIIGVVGGLFTAKIIGLFQATLERNLILAAFIPLVVYVADAVGTQLEAFSIRDISLFQDLNFLLYFGKQFAIVSSIAFILGFIISAIGYVMYNSLDFALVLGFSVFCASISSVITGLLLPFLLRGQKTDPANASGPIGTILQDLMSVVIYFTIATWLL